MNLDELLEEIRKVSSEKIVQDLSILLVEWKGGDETAEDLVNKIEKYLGNTWINKNKDYEKIYQMWAAFKEQAFSGIGGMTMNERLYCYGLFERFDACSDDNSKLVIYRKLHATL